MRRYRTVIIITLLGIIPLIAGVFVMRYIVPANTSRTMETQAAVPAPTVEKPELRMLLAAARDLPVGTLLGEEDLRHLEFEVAAVRRGHIPAGDANAARKPYGYVVREAIADGTQLTWQALVGPQQRGFLAAVLKPDMRAITIKLGAGTRYSGLVDPGDRVDVVLTAKSRESGGLQNVLARTILEDVRVLAVDRRIGSAAGSAGDAGAVERTEIVTATLEVLPAQTGLLALGEFEGELALAVRPLAAAGVRTEASDAVGLRTLLALPEAPPAQAEPEPAQAQPELRRTVRVIRGTTVTGETFGFDGTRAGFENAGLDTGQ